MSTVQPSPRLLPFRAVLVTGGAGFIGSHFLDQLLPFLSSKTLLLHIDALTYAGNPEHLRAVQTDPRYRFFHASICDRSLLHRLFRDYPIDAVVNFAAESHVDRSIADPSPFFETNIGGVAALLDTAKEAWQRENRENRCFLQISTDEVYGEAPEGIFFTEDAPLRPSSPYAASKAAADLLVLSYAHTYGLPINITRCSNNYGPRQYPEKLIPRFLSLAREGKPLPLYGDGLQTRDWLYVSDHCDGLLAVLERGKRGDVYNLAGQDPRTNLSVAKDCLRLASQSDALLRFVADRPGHDRRYGIDDRKARQTLGFAPKISFAAGLTETAKDRFPYPSETKTFHTECKG